MERLKLTACAEFNNDTLARLQTVPKEQIIQKVKAETWYGESFVRSIRSENEGDAKTCIFCEYLNWYVTKKSYVVLNDTYLIKGADYQTEESAERLIQLINKWITQGFSEPTPVPEIEADDIMEPIF